VAAEGGTPRAAWVAVGGHRAPVRPAAHDRGGPAQAASHRLAGLALPLALVLAVPALARAGVDPSGARTASTAEPVGSPPQRGTARPLAGATRPETVAAPRERSPKSASRQPGSGAARTLRVIVVDTSGAPVPDARVSVEAPDAPVAEVLTGGDGRAVLDGGRGGEVWIRATAPGFAPARVRVTPTTESGTTETRIVLQPARLEEIVTVTAARGTRALEAPGGTSVVTAAELLASAPSALDDVLRHTPGFSLFRRSSSRVANPTTQGVTLRGLSGSGASRTLVLADGQPLNDPFGSWVYWNRVPQAAVDRVEVVRGAAGDLYGADALGGVIQVVTFEPGRSRLRATLDIGSRDTARASLFLAASAGPWAATFAGEAHATSGTPIVARGDRGPVDVPAGTDYLTGFASAGRVAGAWRAVARVSAAGESRDNGTPLQVNDTTWRQVAIEAGGVSGAGAWTAHAAAGRQRYYQSFSAVAADRASERLTTEQWVPARFASGGAQWSRQIRGASLVVGGDLRRIEADLRERRFTAAGAPLGPFHSGGIETSGALYGRLGLAAGRTTAVVGARADGWRSDPRDPALPAHAVRFFSPRVSLAWQATPTLALRGALARAHRTPTLNELHRGFRVGNVVTDPNPRLDPEHLTSLEGSALWTAPRLSMRVTGYWSQLADVVTNVTVSVTPALVTRQRQNADTARARGLELEVDYRPAADLRVSFVAVASESRFHRTPSQPAIEGNRLPQTPRYQLGAGLTYTGRIATVSVQTRGVGAQFDDDQNQIVLERFGVVDVAVTRSLGRGVHVALAAENLLDAEYATGRTPVRTVGWPRTVWAGVRVFLP
jgi:outer membrane receptor protein involved in Fe transport